MLRVETIGFIEYKEFCAELVIYVYKQEEQYD